jgi:hypothetical protein
MTVFYKKRMILRFRDLVTELGGTISEHRSILRSADEVWWGWMMRPQENVPRTFFCETRQNMNAGSPVELFLFDTGSQRQDEALFRCRLSKLAVAPKGTRIGSPEPEKTPEYYNRGRYPAWFQLKTIDAVNFAEIHLYYDSFPSSPTGMLSSMIDHPVDSLEALRHHDVTLWVVREE